MEPDDLLCSRNARSLTPLVGRAQWKINQPPSLEKNEQAWGEYVYRSMRAVKGSLGHSPKRGIRNWKLVGKRRCSLDGRGGINHGRRSKG
jgi:hypothetical protein